ncbi:unnamed protein product, partial [Didymodactylos carnosus]
NDVYNYSNLTSLMTPFEELGSESTFCCTRDTLREQYESEYKELEYYHLNELYVQDQQPPLPYFYSLWKTSVLLPRLYTPCEHKVMINLLNTFHQLCKSNNITYMICDGTLLGSYRNHDILPYDDDLDVLVSEYDRLRLLKIKDSISDDQRSWTMFSRGKNSLAKFYFRELKKAGRTKWKWPFIDIFGFQENSTHIWFEAPVDKKYIYPLVLRPIASQWLWSPRSIFGYYQSLQKRYELYSESPSFDQTCLQQRYSHRFEEERHKFTAVNCSQLHNIYPYIRRTCNETKCFEHLMINENTTMYSLNMDKDAYAHL